MKYQWSFAIYWGCLIVGIVLCLCQFLIGGVAVLLVGVVQALIFYRCPKCGASLLMRTGDGIPNYCPKCGQELFEGRKP